ncbi:Proline-rich spliceosome-associated (PSP) family protein / zinc knuckle (CCHC-type) family protein [Euphorbia peplus]|nr:Proline-rich spliceosome-associated (PSP) family protein / zinc knuckle (CCHC-type) family protein [Euphorbia peplus]
MISGDRSENNELLKSELEPGEAVLQHSNFQGEESVLVDSCSFNGSDTISEKGTNDIEKVDLSENNIKHATGSDNFEENEVVKSERSNIDIQIMGLHGSNDVAEDTAKENLGDNAVGSVTESRTDPDTSVHGQDDVTIEDGQIPMDTEVDMDLVDSPVRPVDIKVADTVIVTENLDKFGITVNSQNGYLDNQDDAPVHKPMHRGSVSGVKRARLTYDEEHPSVHVTYNSLPRTSKRKLEEMLLKWSEWHALHSSSQDPNEALESGEETYFPALRVGMEKSSSVSFWIENQTKKDESSDLLPESVSAPLYDRGFAFGLTSADAPSNAEGGLEIVGEDARCFNCGSYSHSLKECRKPRDNAAVNHARKQHKFKKNQNAGSRNAARYYQNSSGGKYDGLKPGALDSETRRLLGLGELDPPPWLNRMRELGYPPGYLDAEEEDQPSGITIFADEDAKVEQEDGEIIETECPELPPKKKAVDFPGVNAPIPENADERAWAAGPSSYDPYRKRSHNRSDHSSESMNRRHHHEQRASRDSIDEGPPGVNSVFSPPASSYPPRYGNYDSTASFARSYSDRGRRSPLDDPANHSSSQYSSNKRLRPWENETDDRWRPQDDSPARSEREGDDRPSNYSEPYSYHRQHYWR